MIKQLMKEFEITKLDLIMTTAAAIVLLGIGAAAIKFILLFA